MKHMEKAAHDFPEVHQKLPEGQQSDNHFFYSAMNSKENHDKEVRKLFQTYASNLFYQPSNLNR